ncbi:hypothetical protein [Microbacterium sp.]|uniref:hypothetical protein n=1 Tax=Microbacterium sp. TaxID=51671 RepID=UPI003F992BE1
MTYQGGYAAPYQPPVDSRYAPVVAPRPKRTTPRLGRVALVLAIGAFVLAAVPLWFAGHSAGRAIGVSAFLDSGVWTWAVLAPARPLIIIGEIGFWLGSALGVWALIQGIVALRTQRGRAPAVWAIVVAAASPILLAALTSAALAVGVAAA